MVNLMVTKCGIKNYYDQIKLITLNTTYNKSVAEFPVKGSGLTPLDSPR